MAHALLFKCYVESLMLANQIESKVVIVYPLLSKMLIYISKQCTIRCHYIAAVSPVSKIYVTSHRF